VADAMAAMVGQNYGAKNYDRVVATFWTGWRFSCLFMLVGTLLCWFFPERFIHLFSSEATVVQYGVIYLGITSLANLPVGSILTISAVFQGIGKTYPSLVCALADNLLFVVAVLTLPVLFGWGFASVWWIKLAATCFETTVLSLWLSRRLKRL